MGCDIHMIVEQRDDQDNYQEIEGEFTEGPVPFDWRNYGMFGFLADIRNYSAITPISEPRGLPSDFKDNGWSEWNHSHSWLSVEELTNYDYDQVIENRRCTINGNGGHTCEIGQGKKQSLREFLGEAFFYDLQELNRIKADRIVFCFDS